MLQRSASLVSFMLVALTALSCGKFGDGGSADTGCSGKTIGGSTPSKVPSWTQISLNDAPSGRMFHSAVWSGSHMLIWGGLANTGLMGLGIGPVNSGGSYRPQDDTWTSLTQSGAPTVRYGHCAVWTGTEMLVWGGDQGSHVRDDGGAYNPATDRWRSLATTDAPSARLWPACVWTGKVMFVWGGVSDDQSEVLRGGATYDPATDSWQAMDANAGPAYADSLFGFATWTGKEVLLWNALAGKGARYHPDSKVWTAINQTGAPSLRYAFAATYAQDKFYLWGGLASPNGAGVNDGAIYDPAMDSWSPMTSDGAPQSRWGATLLALEGRLHLWGGWSSDQKGAVAKAALYTPNGNTWTSLDTSNAPAARALHTVVPTDQGMLVWGGTNFLPAKAPDEDAVSYLRGLARMATSAASSKWEEAKSKGTDALSELKNKISVRLTWCPQFSLFDPTGIESLIFTAPLGGAGGLYVPPSKGTNPTVVTAAPPVVSAWLAMDHPDDKAKPVPPREPSVNCWEPLQ